MRRTKQEAAETREQVLKAALTVFGRRGYSAATLEEVASEAGVTRGAIYWHFAGKAELYVALLEQYSARSGQVVQAAAAQGGSLVQVLRRIFIDLLAAVESESALRAMMELSLFKTERSPELAASQARQLESSRALLEGVAVALRQGVLSGELRPDLDPLEMARAFLALQNGAVYLWLLDPSAFSLSASAPALAEVFLLGVRAQA